MIHIPTKCFSPRAAYRLVLAGRLLQARGWKIRTKPGESYPQAVLALVEALPVNVRDQLKSEIDFLESLGTDGAPSDVIRQRWIRNFKNGTEK